MLDSDYFIIIPIFIPHLGCPHRCVFCNQSRISSYELLHPSQIPFIIKERLWSYRNSPKKTKLPRRVQIAFYGGSFTGIDVEMQRNFLGEAKKLIDEEGIDSIRVSTRPDYIYKEGLRLLSQYGVKTVELGVQSMVDEVLKESSRGYGESEVKRAVKLLKIFGFEIGIQLMVGLPADDEKGFIYSVEEVIKLSPNFVRIYPTLVIKDTPLADLYLKGNYAPLSLEEAIRLCKEALILFRGAGIPVIRLGLQANEDLKAGKNLLAGPYHPAFGQLVESEIFFEKTKSFINSAVTKGLNRITIKVNPKDSSTMKGQRNYNMMRLKECLDSKEIRIEEDPAIKRGQIVVDN